MPHPFDIDASHPDMAADARLARELHHELAIRGIHGLDAVRTLALAMCIEASAASGPVKGRLDIAGLLSPMLAGMTVEAAELAGKEDQLISNAALMAMASALMNTDSKAAAITALMKAAAQILSEDFDPSQAAGLIIEGMADALAEKRMAAEGCS
ncbi:hypothetical protein GVO57_09340 [Sphingomonas changnyeongensis]|uniref:Uncharacterized protein n=1 Tax=Sphingomonas changnyeongensis TaxID=2698679 RepID=A0A7Z2NX54_9SPHN|nr:hypothetical protein [Sphingomonas changnyeongensis]QHL90985.1 hypothetical protein GVO57_09340 [Sphingomonas changnyeongensis]